MTEYINKAKAIAYVEEQYRLFKGDASKQAIVEGCIEALMFTPTADVEEVKHGKWIVDGDITECSNCHKEYVTARGMLQLEVFDYCPNCGAKMDGGKAE
jgi:hypothetical protein